MTDNPKLYIGRVVALGTGVATLALAVLPVIGDMDFESTAGILAGVLAVTATSQKWLDGLQKHEARASWDEVNSEEL